MLEIYTDGGCKDVGGSAATFKNDTGTHVWYQGIKAPTSNNIAEIRGVTTAFNMAMANDIKEFVLRSDSKYVLDGLEKWYPGWAANNFRKSDGQLIKNKDEWVTLASTRDVYRKQGGTYTAKHVKGHAGHEGNERADKYATLAMAFASKHDYDMKYETPDSVVKDVPTTDTKPAKLKAPEYSKLHMHPVVYFRVGGAIPTYKDLHVYYSGKQDSMYDIGALHSENRLGVCMLKEPLPFVADIIEEHKRLDKKKLGYVGQILTSIAYYKNNAHKLKTMGMDALRRVGVTYTHPKEKEKETGPQRGHGNWRDKDDLYLDDDQITHISNPPGLSFILEKDLRTLELLLRRYVEGTLESDNILIEDVTDVFYATTTTTLKNKKTKTTTKVHPDIKVNTRDIKRKLTIWDEPFKVDLRLGVDMPSRNNLSGVLKAKPESLSLKMVYVRDRRVVKYYFIFDVDGEYSIYGAQCSNVLISRKRSK